ncbi:CHAT domain-containing protein [Oscillatoria acuminata]|uniref:CHAT domain-containing protein n=1 Tax=Oscillatoria acuminata PCC 6304 TaxID=56110 RepID=K9TE87_9CYAN|nr:CHAT domain-containing protein [Oscillatoria acuminata]AFY80309.1 hypothetical protein Oscil6304_0568 [Oscillatoria acuminata PCC 6304]
MFDNLMEQINSLNRKARTAYDQGQYEQGIQFAKQACELGKYAFGENHPDYARILNVLAHLYRARGRLTDAEPLLLQAMDIFKVQLGEDHPDYATSLNNLAALYYVMGRLTDAERLYRKAMEIIKMQLGENHPNYAGSLNNLASLYHAMGWFTYAERLYRQAMEIIKVQLGENHPDYATSLNNLAGLYQAMGRWTDAERLHWQAMEIIKVQLGENHPDYATSLNNLALLYKAMGQWTDAEPRFRQAMEIIKVQLGENHPSYATSLSNLAGVYYAMGQWTDAEHFYGQAIEIFKVQLGENHPSYAGSLNNLAGVYYAMGRWTDAEHFYGQAMEIIKVQLGEDHPDYATSLSNLAVVYQAMGQWTNAEPLLLQAIKIRKVQLGENHPDYAGSLNNLAALYSVMGRLTDAAPLSLQAMKIIKVQLGENHPSYVTSLHNLAGLYHAMGGVTDAETLHRQSMEIIKVQLGENHPLYTSSLNYLASLYKRMGRWTDAERLYWQAMEIRKVQLGENHPDYATSLNNLASLYQGMGRLTDAKSLHLRAMEIRKVQLGENHPDYADSLNNFAVLMAAMNRPDEAFRLMQEANQITNRIIGDILSISSDRQRLEYMQQNYWQLEEFLSLIIQYFPEDAAAKRAGLDLVLRRKGLATEAGLLMRTLIMSGRYPHLKPELEKLGQLIQQVGAFTLKVPSEPLQYSAYQEQLARLKQEQEDVERSLSRQIPEMNLQTQLDSASREAITQSLPKGATLLEFVRVRVRNFQAVKANGDKQSFPARYLAFVLSAGDAAGVEMIDLGEAEEIDRLCRIFRQSVSGEEQSNSKRDIAFLNLNQAKTPVEEAPSPVVPLIYTTPEGQDLYQKLIAPLKPYVQPHQTVYIAPDGELATLPFGILSGDGSAYLMAEYALRYLSVGRDLLRFQFPIPVDYTASLVIANPDYNLQEDEPLKILEIPSPQPQGSPQTQVQLKRNPPKQPQPIAQEMMLGVGGAIAAITFFILLAVFPPVGIVILCLGMIWLVVVVHKGSYGDRLQEFEAQAREYDRQVTQVQPIPPPPPKKVRPEAISIKPAYIGSDEVRSLSRELGRGSEEVFTPLPGTQIEGSRIAQLLGVPVYTQAQAVKSLLSQCHSPEIVHIATHGYFLPLDQTPPDVWGFFGLPTIEMGGVGSAGMVMQQGRRLQLQGLQDPMRRSGLAFAGANTVLQERLLPEQAEDGLLTAQNAVHLDLTGTRLVVMSACDTALGDQSIGEGVLGLRRSLILAGAETVVMSLWKVPDVPTAILMERFYHNLFETDLGRTVALEKAQEYLKTLQVSQLRQDWLTPEAIEQVGQLNYGSATDLQKLTTKPDDFTPYAGTKYWAAFVCIGNPSPFPKSASLSLPLTRI